MIRAATTCDIFCRVVDNYGDIGVAWRLARQLTHDHQLTVRLIVDDLASFSVLEPTINNSSPSQVVGGVTVISWPQSSAATPADLVIETFAVNLPEPFIAAMAAKVTPPVWINLEYLSAESWIGEHHLLPSPHPKLSLTKYFFFPGFTRDTGGLIRERELIAERDAYVLSNNADKLQVFLFGYRNAACETLLQAMCESKAPIRCTIPESALAGSLKQVGEWPNNLSANFEVETIPFCAQHAFDRLLWRHDVLFVRGEDSFVRAQWAAKPFVWQIYPQPDDVHWTKLNAFLSLYCDGLENKAAMALQNLWCAWNAEDCTNIVSAWGQFVTQLPTLKKHAKAWADKLVEMPDLAANLLSFYQKTTKI